MGWVSCEIKFLTPEEGSEKCVQKQRETKERNHTEKSWEKTNELKEGTEKQTDNEKERHTENETCRE